jgi:homogentisate 1,2-dioxygenase
MTAEPRAYQLGFGNEFETEVEPGALPAGQNSPQSLKYGLVSELISGTTFSAPRALNRRSYLFRIHPSVSHGTLERMEVGAFVSAPFDAAPDPNQMRWRAQPFPTRSTDFLQGLTTVCGNGDVKSQTGVALHSFACNQSMVDQAFSNADGEMLCIIQHGEVRFVTELGVLDCRSGEFAVIPRGIKWRAELPSGPTRGFVCENYGAPFRLPELGLIGSTGLANAYDFLVPVAAYEDIERPVLWIHKYGGNFWRSELNHSPFDVVAWRGNNVPYKYDMRRFVAMGTATVDHPDPSIYCALTSPSDHVAGGNADLMILPERWLVAEHSFRPPGFHRNSVAEFMSIIQGKHDAKGSNFEPGGASLHNNWAPHGPDMSTLDRGRSQSLAPQKLEATLVFMIETRYPLQVTSTALASPCREQDYTRGWSGFKKQFRK